MTQIYMDGVEITSSLLAAPGTAAGDRARDLFIAQLASLGKMEILYLPKVGNTTTNTGESLDARTGTYSKDVTTFDDPPGILGSGLYVQFDGTDEEIDYVDVDDLSLGDGAADNPFSAFLLVNPDVNNAAMVLMAKESSATAEEWRLELNASGHLVATLTDESASATIIGTFASAVGTSWTLLGMTYDGTGSEDGIQLYQEDAAVTTVRTNSGSYTAMENTAAILSIAARYSTKERFFNGGIAFGIMYSKALVAAEVETLKSYVNAFYNL